ncbi:MAG: glycosyltransferase N-terminal domain-containing protein [Chthoniobacterales bacterium]
MIRLLYNLFFPLALLLFLPGYLLKMFRRGNYRNKFEQRLGFYDRATRAKLSRDRHTWLHAVSVGEVMIALKLAEKMKETEPALRVALTTTTTTGFALARRQAPSWTEVLYTPLDWWPIMRRAFSVIRPTRIVLVEAEVWPNLTAIAHRKQIPLALVNARLSPRSEDRFKRFNWFVRPYFRQLDLIGVQELGDIARWTTLGAQPAHLHLTGSIKFDPVNVPPQPAKPSAVLQDLGISAERPILLAGSTHLGEEEILAQVFLELRGEFPDLLLIIAPRHIERAREIAAQLHRAGLTTVSRSGSGSAQPPDCLILDTTGELRDWYAVATVVFIGKSLTARGGQNPVEAIVADRPVVFGPHMENFAALSLSLVAAGGALQVDDATRLPPVVSSLLRDRSRREDLARRARAVLDQHRGATERTAALLAKMPGSPA